MTLIKSISGIRGTIGGEPGNNLSPLDVVKFTSAYASYIKQITPNGSNTIVVGRDARISGTMVMNIVCGTLIGMGYNVKNIGLATTPTTELAVKMVGADGGIIITASHNPKQWNALKLLNKEGEFLTAEDGQNILEIAEKEAFCYADIDHIGVYETDDTYDEKHIEHVLNLKLVDVEAIKAAKFKVLVDAVNSVGGVIMPKLLDKLGVEYKVINGEPTGHFAHTPEPLAKNLTQIMGEMAKGGYHLGIVVDPDVDRLVFICENGDMFGEEYTLVSVADYVLSKTPGNTVSNLSSTRALRDVTLKHQGHYTAAAVGEVNVTTQMKAVNAVIGGEGNGGVIYPESHYGRDALVGVGLFLSCLAHKGCTASQLRATYPTYFMAKNKIDLTPTTDIDAILEGVKAHYANETITDIDGVKIDFADSWVHLRKSNTEPIIRIYSEAKTEEEAQQLGETLISLMQKIQG